MNFSWLSAWSGIERDRPDEFCVRVDQNNYACSVKTHSRIEIIILTWKGKNRLQHVANASNVGNLHEKVSTSLLKTT